MALVVAQPLVHAGLAAAYSAASGGGDQVRSGDSVFLHVKNGAGAPITCTLVTPGLVGGLAIADNAVSVAAGTEKFIGPLAPDLFGNPTDAWNVNITWSSPTSVTFAALYLP